MKKLLITIPTYNESLVIEKNIRDAYSAFTLLFSNYDWSVVVADNGSTDTTSIQVQDLCKEFTRLRVETIQKKGRGNALRQLWETDDSDIFAYMDVDLATHLDDFAKIIQVVENSDLVVGSRLLSDASVKRSWFREVLSQGYSRLVQIYLRVPVKDLQCGCKAIQKTAWQRVAKHTTHPGWFFDTELVAFSCQMGFDVREIPVRWVEKRNPRRKSTVDILATVMDNLRHLFHLHRRLKRLSDQNLVK